MGHLACGRPRGFKRNPFDPEKAPANQRIKKGQVQDPVVEVYGFGVGFRVWCLGFRGLGFRVLGFRV